MINNDAITEVIQQFATIRSQVGVNSEGQLQLAELMMEIGLEHYQGPEDFYPTPTTDIGGFDVTLAELPGGTA